MTIINSARDMELRRDDTAAAVRRLELQHAEHRDATLYRFEKGSHLQFNPGPTLMGRKVYLYTNYVVTDQNGEKGEHIAFDRKQYYCLEWVRAGQTTKSGETAELERLGCGLLVTDTDAYCELRLERAGSFHYYFVYDTPESRVGPQGSGWFGVTPSLRAGDCTLPLDSLMCQTVLAKCLGPISRWERTLRVGREAGYNVFHLTPVQELGASGSSYSIADQLKLNPLFDDPDTGRRATFSDIENLVAKIHNEWNTLVICDVVLNHTANETPWLPEHPEATYNCQNCPHLRPAALLDAAFARVSARVGAGLLEPRVPREVTEPAHVDAARAALEEEAAALRLSELFQCDVDALERRFLELARARVPVPHAAVVDLKLTPDPQRRRLAATVDLELALQLFNTYRADCPDEEARLARCAAAFHARLLELNAAAAHVVLDHLRAAVDNCAAAMRYERLQSDGPRLREVSARHPLVPPYFTLPETIDDAAAVETDVYGESGRLVMAHNGWVMGADPLQDFAARAADGRVYLRRELVAWGDSVKLRYGERPEDSAWLWAHMREYVRLTARLFDGLRLDNCHSTPLHVAEWMVDEARAERPDLYVVAELFTNSAAVDNIFVNRLGITSLVREAQSAWDAHELGRLVYRYGGRPAGAFLPPPPGLPAAAAPAVAHAMLMDQTHDNPSPVVKRSLFDLLPCAALVAFASCATGSTRGYDELVPHQVHVVDEARLYRAWGESDEWPEGPEGIVGPGRGLAEARAALNALHRQLAAEGYSEVFVDQMDPDVVAVTRHHPASRKSVILVAHTAFAAPDPAAVPRRPRPLRFEGQLTEVALEASLRHEGGRPFQPPRVREPHPRFIDGLDEYVADVRPPGPLAASAFLSGERREGAFTELEWRGLPPGAVVVVRVAPDGRQAAALAALHRTVRAPPDAAPDPLQLAAPLAELSLADFNTLLYCCDAEERERRGAGAYEVPGHGPLVYAGLQGTIAALEPLLRDDDLGHPLCDNLRAGDWLADYQWRRIEGDARLATVAARYRDALRPLGELPRFLVPAYFAAVVAALHSAVRAAALSRLRLPHPGRFAEDLALTSVQLTAAMPSAPLPLEGASAVERASLSAGLPHFSVGYMRCWGRDTFIALRGLFLLTGRFAEARAHILAFAACLRHGLIPNLLDGGRNARFNCRDAVWWWLHSIQQYCREAPQGSALLAERVVRLFPAPDAPVEQPLHDVMQEALDTHFQGLAFRERNAGRQIDAHMTDRGFNVQIGVDPETGFPFGGNDANCGTWMDKMGSSERAGTRGRPATPRDGSAVELVALAYGAASWLATQHRAARYPYPGVARRHRDGALTAWTFAQWAERIRRSFERHFWVPAAPSATDARPDLVHRRGIYKDSHGASQPWADYQLRCNFPVAMAVAPDLFDPKRAWLALDAVERLLLGPLGVKTLDPADWAYRPDYRNDDDSADPSVAHGFNYHQGPEWVWPIGAYLRARLAFASDNGAHARTVAAVYAALGPHAAESRASPWRGLPELTDAGGAPCRDSCRTQAWSSACVLEALHEAAGARRARPLPSD
ncbi:glycogen debranching enzyme [Pieris brassicae]|uniref:glycogen debranching enzyme n=1 Tax=Pieris brassicae TaxID=7116 RepID=UPI001E662566|nr:glycogen debranching enzyme [Pieris brassicae]